MRPFFLLFFLCFCLCWSSSLASSSPEECGQEFEHCYFRECCEGLTCETPHRRDHLLEEGNRRSTCYSERSAALDAKSDAEKFELIRRFYEELVPPGSRKSTDEIKQMMAKHKQAFPKLVERLEKQYRMSMVDLDAIYIQEL